MPENKFMKRIYKPHDFFRLLKDLMSSAGDTRKAPKDERISHQFSERIMMAVTEVNGCRYCSYFHTQVSLRAGMKKEEITRLLDGNFEGAPDDELAALHFAQHYAESGGKPNPDAIQCMIDAYGEIRTREITAVIRAIMVGNAWGNMFDALRHRLRGEPKPDVTMWDEMGVLLGPLVMVPWVLVSTLFKNG